MRCGEQRAGPDGRGPPRSWAQSLGQALKIHLATWVTSAAGLATAAFFDVGWPAKMVFAAWAVAWSGATVIALRHARARRFAQHRQWMVRSFALALVFMIFDVVRSALAGMELPRTTVYATGLLLTVIISLAPAELWIRTRAVPWIRGAS
jgi:uncharacterized membrane protein YozB (DUF420 family)